MNRSRVAMAAALIVGLTLTVVGGAQQSAASDYGGIDPAVALAWERAGAHFQRVFDRPGFAFTAGEAPSPADISTLPVPAVPFGLKFERVLMEPHLRALAALPRLQTLICDDCDAANLQGLAGLKQLESFAIQFQTEPVAGDLPRLGELPRLRELRTGWLTKADARVVEIAGLRQLEALSLAYSDLTDEGLKKLVEMPQLRWLDIHDTKVTAGGLSTLRSLPRLTHLELGRDTLSAATPAELARLTQLESLTLWYPTNWTDAWVKQLAGLVNLRKLWLIFYGDQGPSLTDAGITDLARFTRLEELSLYGARITDTSLRALSPLKHLRVLDLNNTTVTDAGMRELAGLQELADLVLPEAITDEGLKSLAALPHLRSLTLAWRHRVTTAGVTALTTARPSLKINGLSSRAILRQFEVDAAMAITSPEVRLAALEGVRGRASVPDLRRIDQAILTTLVASSPDHSDRLLPVLDRVIAAIPSGSSPERRLALTMDAVQPLADALPLAGRIEEFMTAALAGVTGPGRTRAGNSDQGRPRAAGLAVLGRAQLAQGHVAQARTTIEASLALLPSRTDRSAPGLFAVLGQIEARDGRDDRALDHYITAAALATLTPAQENELRALYRKVHGSDSGLEPALSARHRELVPSPVTPTAYVPSPARSTRVVLLELFTGSGCPPCVAADLAFEALLERYPPDAVAGVSYHVNVPLTDPMVVTGGIRRDRYYDAGTPSMAVDGRLYLSGGGSRAVAPKTYANYASTIDKQLEATAAAALSVNAHGEGDQITVQARVAGLPREATGLRLHLLLVERELGFAGENGIRQHPMVVRAVAGAEGAGLPVAGAGTMTHTFSLSAVRADVEATLAADIASRRARGGARVFFAEGHAQTTIDTSRLVVVAFVQQGVATGDASNVLQAAQTDVVFKK